MRQSAATRLKVQVTSKNVSMLTLQVLLLFTRGQILLEKRTKKKNKTKKTIEKYPKLELTAYCKGKVNKKINSRALV
jgi:hypothetical protein